MINNIPTDQDLAIVLVLCGIFLLSIMELRSVVGLLRRRPVFSPRVTLAFHLMSLAFIVFFLYASFIEPYWLAVRHFTIYSDKLKENEFTIVQISDTHCDEKARNEDKIVRIVNEIHPDIVVFTGDAINSPAALLLFRDTMKNMRAVLGKLAVKGNWDVNFHANMNLFDGTGFEEVLKGEARIFAKGNDKIVFLGLSPYDHHDMTHVLRQVERDDYTVLLYHYPGINEEIKSEKIDLFLAGHTHGGQVALPFYGAIITLSKYGKKYEAGYYKLPDDKVLYVNSGVGMDGEGVPRVRFFARPEIAVFRIKPRGSR